MRLPGMRLGSRSLLIPSLIAADLLVLWIWAARPRRIFEEWLGLVEYGDEAPIGRLARWVAWQDGPRTPSGFVSLFGIVELFFAAVLLLAPVILLAIPLAARWSEGALRRRLAAPVKLAGAAALRFRIRTALVVIAILGLYLSWEVHAWRTWRLRASYQRRADQERVGESTEIARFLVMRSLLDDLRTGQLDGSDYSPAKRGGFRSKAKFLAEGFATRDRVEREITYLSAKIAAIAALKRKYERAAADPRIALEPDAPFPEREPEANERSNRDPARALAAYDKLARAHPDLVEAHSASAWVRATCRDARYRDGKLAASSATRACELTNWHDSGALAALAAACAEAGDFVSAAKWQKEVVALTGKSANAQADQERLDLYLAAKPYRQ
jgi:hypothetical protein